MIGKIVVLAVPGLLASVAAATPVVYGTTFSGPHSASTLYSISAASGAAKAIGAIGFNQVRTMAFAPNGSLFGVGRNGADKWVLLKIDLISGAGTAVGPTGLDASFRDIVFRSDGTLYGYARSTSPDVKAGLVYAVNTNTGAARLVGNLAEASDENAPVAFSSDKVLYSVGTRSLAMIAANNSGAVTPLQFGSSLAGFQPAAAKFDSGTGTLWALGKKGGSAPENYLATVDVKTGTVAPVAKTTAGLQGIAIEPHDFGPPPPPGPLPSSILFIISGVLAIALWNAWAHFRRRNAAV